MIFNYLPMEYKDGSCLNNQGKVMAERIKINYPANELFAAAVRIVKKVRKAGFEMFFVGGAVRDLVLGRTPSDIDMVTTALPQDICDLFPYSEMVGACFGVVLVKQDGFVFEVATCREERLYSDGRRPDEVKFTKDVKLDLARRDFTVNAMLYDPLAGEVIDYVGGLQDIKKRLLRVVGVPQERFSEDYLRMLRAIRFAAKLQFEIDTAAWDAICAMKSLCAEIAAERVRDELENMFCSIDAAKALKLLKASGILAVWLPEVDVLSGVEQHPKYHPEGDVWVHTVLMFEKAGILQDKILAWSILLHDIGKKPAFSLDCDNIPHFYGHEAMGADMVLAIAQRLRFSREMADAVEHAVRYHMRFASVMNMREAKLKRLMAEKYFVMELELHRQDCLCSNGLTAGYDFLRERMKNSVQLALPELFLNGSDLIKLGYKPGRLFKEILDKLMDAQLDNRISCREEALKFVKENFTLN